MFIIGKAQEPGPNPMIHHVRMGIEKAVYYEKAQKMDRKNCKNKLMFLKKGGCSNRGGISFQDLRGGKRQNVLN